jgi:hypothetical protein
VSLVGHKPLKSLVHYRFRLSTMRDGESFHLTCDSGLEVLMMTQDC